MPKARVEREVSNDGNVKVIEIETAAGGEDKGTVTARYTVPATPEAFQNAVMEASSKPDGGAFFEAVYGRKSSTPDKLPSPLAFMYQHYINSVDKAVRTSVYESIQQESTEISVGAGKPKFDLMTVAADKLVIGINGMRGKRASDLMVLGITDPDVEEHAESIKSVDRKLNYNQFQTAARKLVDAGKARENAASGMLEVVGKTQTA
jgi:hypothetical protein